MKVEEAAQVSFKSKLSKPCKKILHVFKFRMRKPFSLKSLWSRRAARSPRSARAETKSRKRAWSWFRWLRRVGRMKRVRELRGDNNRADGSREKLLFPSPKAVAEAAAGSSVEEVEDACRSFENYLVEMVIEEGKVRDLMDVEELLYCWGNLKCPVFVDLVSRFYGELCKDLFSDNNNGAFTPNFQLSKRYN